MSKTLASFATWLTEHFQSSRSRHFEMRIALRIENNGELVLDICNQCLNIESPAPAGSQVTRDVTLSFDSLETAAGLLSGEISPLKAFMQGKFRSDGYLMMTFKTLQLFLSKHEIESATE